MPDARPASPTTGAPPWRRHHWGAVLGVLSIAVAVGWWSRPSELGAGGDDATYVELSHSLEQGRYNEEYLVGTPPHGKYPPGMPVWIAMLRQVAGPNLDVVRLGNLLLLALTATLTGSAVRRLGGAWLGVGAVAVTALNPTLLMLAGQVFSDTLYVALATVAVWASLLADRDNRRRWTLLAAVAALAAFLTRSIGITVVSGIVGWALLRRRWTTAIRFGFASVVVVGGWFTWVRHVATSTIGLTYAEELRALSGQGEGALASFSHRIAENVVAFGAHIDFQMLGLPMLKHTAVDNLFWLLLLAPAAIVGFWLLIRHWPAAAMTAALTAGILLVWPGSDDRLFSPLAPVAVAAILLGGASVGRRLLPRAASLGAGLLPIALSVLGLTTYLTRDRWHTCDRRDVYADAGCFDAESRGLVLSARFVRDSLPEDVVVATNKPATVFYFSGHKTVDLESILRPAKAFEPLKLRALGADFLLLSRMSRFEVRRGLDTIKRGCRELSVRATILSTALLLAQRDSLSELDACSGLARYAADLPREVP